MSNQPAGQKSDAEQMVEQIWEDATEEIKAIDSAKVNWKSQALPLARIKKIMKSEEILYVEDAADGDKAQARFMIAGEAPLLLGKACELLIRELTTRAWKHTEKSKRRTLQKQDIHAAVGDSDVYDFLIDIVPRATPAGVEGSPSTSAPPAQHASAGNVDHRQAGVGEVPALVSTNLPASGQEAGLGVMTADYRMTVLNQMQERWMQQMPRGHMMEAPPGTTPPPPLPHANPVPVPGAPIPGVHGAPPVHVMAPMMYTPTMAVQGHSPVPEVHATPSPAPPDPDK